MQKPHSFRQGLMHSGAALLVFLLVAAVFFKPVLSGRDLTSQDMVQVMGMQQNLKEHREKFGHDPYWSTSMFGGMPAYTIGGTYNGNLFSDFASFMENNVLDYPVWSFFIGMVFSFFLLRALGVQWLLAIAGAIGYAFVSYHPIIYEAGHVSKLRALMYAPGVMLGVVLVFQRKWVSGAVITGVTVALEMAASHQQMSYYLFFVLFAIAVHYGVEAIRHKQLVQFGLSSAILVAAASLGIATSATRLLPLTEYMAYSTRGPSELAVPVGQLAGEPDANADAPADGQKGGALTRDYAFAWSNGRAELLTMLIPSFKGGASMETYKSGSAFEKYLMGQAPLGPQLLQYMQQNNGNRYSGYWGPQSFTSGPFYLGAVLVFMFIIGLMLVDSGIKWALLYSVLIGMFLALGKHSFAVWEAMLLLALPLAYIVLKDRVSFSKAALGLGVLGIGLALMMISGTDGDPYLFSDFFFENLPFYNRFRAPASMLVIVSFAAPVLALMGASRLLSTEVDVKRKLQSVYVAGGLVGGICLIFWVMPSAFLDFVTAEERTQLEAMPTDQQGQAMQLLLKANMAQREAALQADAIRSFLLVALAALVGWLFVRGAVKSKWVVAGGVLALVAIDNLGIGLRYVPWEVYQPDANWEEQHRPRPADVFIQQQLRREQKHARVFPLNRNPWNEAKTAYHLMSVGGYNAAKLKRYQELGEVHLLNPNNKRRLFGQPPSEGITPFDLTPGVLNMLNMEFLITQPIGMDSIPGTSLVSVAKNQEEQIWRNTTNMGPAWIVQHVKIVPTPDSALVGLYSIHTATTAIVEEGQKAELGAFSSDSLAADEHIRLTRATNDTMEYAYQSGKARFVVFSEVYYPKGWKAYVDGNETPILQTNYVLRGITIPAGQHRVTFRFEPESVQTGASISYASSLILLIVAFALGAWEYIRWNRTRKKPSAS